MALAKDTVASKLLADGSTLVENGRGSARLSRVGAGALLYECKGSLSAAFYAPMVAVAQRELEQSGDLAMFVDGWELRSVDTGFREAWTHWFKAHREHFHMRLLVRSRLMEMAASLANLFTGITVIKTYSNIEGWQRACTGDFRGFRTTRRAAG